MRLKDEKAYLDWKAKNSDAYGSACFRYAETWADMMELHIADGKQVKDVADKTSRDADKEGITGFMYGMAVNILTNCWEHGEELRKWHNKEYEYEGDGVVNPAVITVSK